MPSIAYDLLLSKPQLAKQLSQIFENDDLIEVVQVRADQILAGQQFILWEGNAQTCQFSYVSKSAEAILGYPCSRWTSEPSFWADVVVAPCHKRDAVAYCALATGQGRDHDFEYLARTADGRLVSLFDAVKVVIGTRGIPVRLRGIMMPSEAAG